MKRTSLMLLVGLAVVSLLIVNVCANGPANARRKQEWDHPNWASYLYIGPDYGAGATLTETTDGSVVDPILSATLAAKGRYFSEWWEPFSEKDWVTYKFWLTEPVNITLPDGTTVYTATEFIFFRMVRLDLGGLIELVNYK